MIQEGMHIHLVGIGGAGLSAIARVLMNLGYEVSGSDIMASELTAALAAEGATVTINHAARNIDGAELLLVSSAIPPDNPEIVAARAAGVPVLKRADLLGQLMTGRRGIAVAGAHGKTTTTAMLASVLTAARLDPTFIVGGVVAELGTNARAGNGDIFLIEADEYDRTFLGLQPEVAVLTVVEHDHPDCYPTLDSLRDAFREFIHHLPPDGLLVACADDPGVRSLGQEWESTGGAVRWYGFGADATWRATDFQPNQAGGSDFVVSRTGQTVGLVRLRVPGRHNVLNALATIVVADWLGLPFETVRSTLTDFRGVGRRFEIKSETRGVIIVDDYAHHPTEIKATLSAARERFPGRRIWAVFQPHTYSRTRALMDEFARAFAEADEVIVLDIYAAREADHLGVSAEQLVNRMTHPRARYIASRHAAADYLVAHLRPGDVLLTMGAGDGYMVGEWVSDALESGWKA
jgi:UDP-N-acetylmuramate--alanine ligase